MSMLVAPAFDIRGLDNTIPVEIQLMECTLDGLLQPLGAPFRGLISQVDMYGEFAYFYRRADDGAAILAQAFGRGGVAYGEITVARPGVARAIFVGALTALCEATRCGAAYQRLELRRINM
jgi:hypothetical protein